MSLRTLFFAAAFVLSSSWCAAATRDASGEAGRYKGWTVSSLEVRGLPQGMAGSLRRGLVLNGRKGVIRTRRALLFPRTVDEDLQRASIWLAQCGYPWADIAVEFRPDSAGRKVEVTLVVDPGPAVRIADFELRGVPEGVETGEAVTLSPGLVLAEDDLARDVAALTGALASSGYPRPSVTPVVALLDSSRASVVLAVETGPLCRFGAAHLDGVAPDLERLVRKNLELPAGDLFAPKTLKRARTNLRELDLFRRIDVSAGELRDGVVDMIVAVQPYKARTLEIDVGYWTDDFLRAGVRWRHRNLFGGGRGAELRVFASEFRRDGTMSLWWPSLLGPRTRVIGRLHLSREFEDAYDLDSDQGELWASRRIVSGGWLQAGIAVADVRLNVRTSDPTAYAAQDGLLAAMRLRMSLDRIDNPIDPTSGTSWSAQVEWSPPGLPSDHHYASARADVTRYTSLGDAVLALRMSAGTATPLGESVDLLPNKRFYAGGSSTMRGSRRRRLGPLDSDNAPLGGRTLLLGSAEVRFPLMGLLRGALFADVGNVWRTRSAAVLSSVQVAVGPSLMITTPVGPVRADLGLNLNDRPPGEPDTLLHLSVGHPF